MDVQRHGPMHWVRTCSGCGTPMQGSHRQPWAVSRATPAQHGSLELGGIIGGNGSQPGHWVPPASIASWVGGPPLVLRLRNLSDHFGARCPLPKPMCCCQLICTRDGICRIVIIVEPERHCVCQPRFVRHTVLLLEFLCCTSCRQNAVDPVSAESDEQLRGGCACGVLDAHSRLVGRPALQKGSARDAIPSGAYCCG
jgi:hypothetical protein